MHKIYREVKFRQVRQFYREGKLTFNNYIESIVDINAFEPKKIC